MFLRKPGRSIDKMFMTQVGAYAAVEFWQGIFGRVAWHYNKDGSQELWAGLGLNTSLGSTGVETEFSMGLGEPMDFQMRPVWIGPIGHLQSRKRASLV